MPSRTKSAPRPRLSVTIAGTSYSVRFVDRIEADHEPRFGWADAERNVLYVAIGTAESFFEVGSRIGDAVLEAFFQLSPHYGVGPTDRLDALSDACLKGRDLRTWLKSGLPMSFAEAATTRPIVAQVADGRWRCPFCRRLLPNWAPVARQPGPVRDHVDRAHGFPADRLRFRRFKVGA